MPPPPSIRTLAIGCLLLSLPAPAALIFPINLPIPDNAPTGFQNTQSLSGFSGSIASLEVHLSLSAAPATLAFNGDFYLTLQHDAGFAVLLNRVGRSSSNPLGDDHNGFDITFALSAPDIHLYPHLSPTYDAAGRLTGSWGADGRIADPDSVLDSSPRLDMLSSFVGLDPNGAWTLFLADLNPYGNASLDSWGLDIATIPEPPAFALLGLGALLLALRHRPKQGP